MFKKGDRVVVVQDTISPLSRNLIGRTGEVLFPISHVDDILVVALDDFGQQVYGFFVDELALESDDDGVGF